MKKVAIVLVDGFEESEALVTIDIIRRSQTECDIFGFEDMVTGNNGITIKSDKIFNDEDVKNYDMLILPGGMKGVEKLLYNKELIKIIQYFKESNKFIATISEAVIILDRAGVLQGCKYTISPNHQKGVNTGIYVGPKDIVIDENIITSSGQATVYAFAYALIKLLEKDALSIKKRMLYFNAFDIEGEE